MTEFTFLKLQFDEFTANAPFSGESEVETAAGGDETDGGSESGGAGKLAALVVGLLFLVLIAVLVRKVRGGDDGIDESAE